MAREIKVLFVADTKQFNAAIDESKRKLESAASGGAKQFNEMRSAISASTVALAAFGVAGVAALKSIGSAALDAAIKLDRQVSSLQALTGSAAAATKRFQELFAIAQKTPGLTTSLALSLDQQLRIFNVAEKTINGLLGTVGRLNAVAPLRDPGGFVQNITQLISGNFDKEDLKELLRASPLAGSLIKEIFNVDSPTNAEAIRAAAKRLGITTVERLAEELIKAGEKSSALKNAVETIGGQFDKLKDRLDVALAPLGKELAKTLIPIFDDLVKSAGKYGTVAAEVFKDNRSEIVQTARAVGGLAVQIGNLATAIFNLGNKGKSGLSGLKEEFEDLESLAAFLTDVSEGNAITRPRTLAIAERQRAERVKAFIQRPVQVGGAPSRFSLLGATSDSSAVRAAAAAASGGGGGGAGRGRRRSGIDVLPLTASDLVTSQFEGEEDFRAIQAARAAGRQTRARLALEAEQFRLERINEGRDTRRQLTAQFDAREVAEAQRLARRDLSRSGRSIGDLLGRGAITASEADALSEAANHRHAQALREILALEQQRGKISKDRKDDLEDEIALYDRLGTAISDGERFMRGFNSQIQTSGDIWDRFGQNVARAFTNIRDLFNGLKQAVLGFFNDILGTALQNLVRQTLGPIFGGLGGARGAATSGGGLAGIFGFGQGFGLGGGGGTGGTGGAASSILSGGKFNFGQLGESLLSSAPLLGLTIGGALGGKSLGGNILGAAGGLLTSTFIATTLGAPGALGGLAPALFSNPLTAIAGAGLLVGSILLGKSKQRKQDEEASGQMLTQALQGIDQLVSAVSSGQLDGGQARAVFENQILAQFIQQIRTLKTKSVVESRLTNQVRDLRNVFESRIGPAIAAQQTRSANALAFSRQIPEFATGGTTLGGLAILHAGEKVVNLQQQSAMRAIGGPNIFEAAGVPGVNRTGIFDAGGTVPGGGGGMPIVIENLNVTLLAGKDDQTRVFVTGANTPQGQAVIVKKINDARMDRQLG